MRPPPGEPTQPLPGPPGQGWSQQPPQPPTQQQPAWGPPPPRPPTAGGLPWYKRWWWAIAFAAFVLGAAIGGASQPEPEVRTETVTQVSERPVWTPECEKIENQTERRQCEGIIAGYNKSLQSAATTTTKPSTPKPTQPPVSTIEDGQYAVPAEVKPGTYRAPNPGGDCYWARLKGFSGDLDDVLANGNPTGPARVAIAATDKGFESARCGGWKKVG
jgi:hypothetical protein